MSTHDILFENAKRCYPIIDKYRQDDFELWEHVKRQVDLILQEGVQLKKEECQSIDFGPKLVRQYDTSEEKEEMQPFYTLYNLVRALHI